MKFSTNFFRSVFLAVVCATAVTAAPFLGSLKHTTIQVREISPDLVVESFHPESTLEVRSHSGYLRSDGCTDAAMLRRLV